MSKVIRLSSALPGDSEINGIDQFAEVLAENPEGTTITAIVIFDSPGFRYSTKDGTRVPLNIVRKKGTALDGRLDQGLAGGNTGDDAPHLGPSFHLQAVWAIIPELCGLQQLFQILHQFFTFH